ncbi:MAG: GNAT family N-acetyltransferase [Eggerthellaceae bacterium]|nr:GNAT family N-acetyltransferase [Eggerthellaceae bacterium]
MIIRVAETADLDDIMRIYDKARETMRASGNRSQWINGYPAREMVEGDIARRESYVVEGDDGVPHAVFMFAVEEDPTYARIEDGAWLDDEPYGVIHRIGSDGELRGVVPAALAYCTAVIGNIRIDTHADNTIMRHVLEKCGFAHCGTIYCHDGSPRVAYQFRA